MRKFTGADAFGPPFDIVIEADFGVAPGAVGAGNLIAVWPQAGTVMAHCYGANTVTPGAAFRVDLSAASSFPGVDVPARRFDAAGHPSGDQMPVSFTTAGSQA